ncbi:MAG TPA: alpha/beta fold hydrolase [Woeseiaceae bacterium]|nr:alpha/beta fold hydrolase [Woeseiaceae bacterium]
MHEPQTVEIEPVNTATGTVLWLHGLGADGHDFEPIVAELALPQQVALRFVFPHAPIRPVTLNGGMRMRAWYDIISLDRSGPQDEKGIRESAAILTSLIERERQRGIANDRVVVAGFSQGGAIAMHTALRHPQRLAGLMALSSWLPLGNAFAAEVLNNPHSQSRELPVFMAHGTFDPMLPITMGQQSRAALQNAGFDVEWHEYPMAHAVCAEEIVAIRKWLLSVFAAISG